MYQLGDVSRSTLCVEIAVSLVRRIVSSVRFLDLSIYLTRSDRARLVLGALEVDVHSGLCHQRSACRE